MVGGFFIFMATAIQEGLRRNDIPGKPVYKFAGVTPHAGTIELHPVTLGDSSKTLTTYGAKVRTPGGRLVNLDILVPDAPAYVSKVNTRSTSGYYGEDNSGDVLPLDQEFAVVAELHQRATQQPPSRRHARVAPFPKVRVIEHPSGIKEYVQQTISGEPIDTFLRCAATSTLPEGDKNLLQLIVLHNAILAIERVHELHAIHGDLRTPNLVVNMRTLEVTPVDFGNAELDPTDPLLPLADGNKFFQSVTDNDRINRALWEKAATFEQDIEVNLEGALIERGASMDALPRVQQELGRKYFLARLDSRIQRATYGEERFTHSQLVELDHGLEEVFRRAQQHPDSFASTRRPVA